MNRVLLYFNLKYKGKWDDIYDALDQKEYISVEDLETVENDLPEGVNYITILSPAYPEFFKNAVKPPFVLFYKGKWNKNTPVSDYMNGIVKDHLTEIED